MPISMYSWAMKHLVNGMRIQLVNYLSENHPASFLLMTSSSSIIFQHSKQRFKVAFNTAPVRIIPRIQWRIIDLRIFEDVSL